MKERYYSLDILRILACLAVLSFHLGKSSPAFAKADACLITPALAVFFILTGFLTDPPQLSQKGHTLWSYYAKKLVHLCVPLYLFTLFYGYLYSMPAGELFCREGIKYILFCAGKSLVDVFSKPAIDQLWFMYSITAIYIIWPFVRAGLDFLGENGRRRLLVLILFIQTIISLYYLWTGTSPYFAGVIYLTGWIVYPIFGTAARDGWLDRYDRGLWITGALCAVINVILCVSESGLYTSADVYSFSPFMLIEVLALLRGFLRLKIKGGRVLKFLSERTFTVYLLGTYVTVMLDNKVFPAWQIFSSCKFLKLPVLIVVTFAAATAVDLILLKNIERLLLFAISSPFNRKDGRKNRPSSL